MRKQTRERGSALIIAIVLVIVVAGLSAAFLTLAVSHNKMTMGATHRENAFMVAESGIDEMIQKINTWSAGTVTTLTGNIGQNGTYTAAISPSFSGAVGTYTITSTGVLYGDASKSNITEKRGITTVIAPSVLYPYSKALFGDVSVDGSGTIFTDSYISSGGSYASQATNYDATHGEYYAGTKGSLGSNGDIDITGASTIYGNATPGPGGTVTTSGGVYITGSTAAATDPEPLPAPTYEPPIAQDDDEYKVTGGTHTIGTAGSTTVVRYG
jgi:hypothetical protein